MKDRVTRLAAAYAPLILTVLVISVAALFFGGYRYALLNRAAEALQSKIGQLEVELAQMRSENTDLAEALYSEQKKNASFAEQIGDITKTVGTLEKWSETDPELLQKYSKIYFLNEHYVPAELGEIPEEYLLRPEQEERMHTQVLPRLEEMIEDAKDDDVDLLVVSAYRSYGEQIDLKISYTVTYGAGANRFSADQGYSEHQLGTTVDFTTPELGAVFSGFGTTEAYAWLTENAYRYGFILSYPKDNTFYQFEPWHWRFVGIPLARRLNREEMHFYDMDQRTIDEYLVRFFDEE